MGSFRSFIQIGSFRSVQVIKVIRGLARVKCDEKSQFLDVVGLEFRLETLQSILGRDSKEFLGRNYANTFSSQVLV